MAGTKEYTFWRRPAYEFINTKYVRFHLFFAFIFVVVWPVGRSLASKCIIAHSRSKFYFIFIYAFDCAKMYRSFELQMMIITAIIKTKKETNEMFAWRIDDAFFSHVFFSSVFFRLPFFSLSFYLHIPNSHRAHHCSARASKKEKKTKWKNEMSPSSSQHTCTNAQVLDRQVHRYSVPYTRH